MTEFVSDRAAADLTAVEEGVLRGLASLGFDPSVADLAEFAAGFARLASLEERTIRVVLFTLDALGWAAPNGTPADAETWRITDQGRIALETKP